MTGSKIQKSLWVKVGRMGESGGGRGSVVVNIFRGDKLVDLSSCS